MKHSKFNLTHTHSTTCEMGKHIPFLMLDCLPNDIFKISNSSIFRAQPMIAPLMHEVNIYTQYYFVPYRILWDNWTEFITGGEDGTAAPNFPVVKSGSKGWDVNSLADYMGFPINQPNLEVSALPFRAYNKIWNDHLKIEDLEDEIEWSSADGEDTTTPQNLLSCNWERDYFTRARHTTQRGSSVLVPIFNENQEVSRYAHFDPSFSFDFSKQTTTKTDDMTVIGSIRFEFDLTVDEDGYGNLNLISYDFNSLSQSVTEGYFLVTVAPIAIGDSSSAETVGYIPVTITWGTSTSYSQDNLTNLEISHPTCSKIRDYLFYWNAFKAKISILEKVTSAAGFDIRDLRIASAMQRFQEKSLKYGSEYEDYIKQEFGMRPKDSRLQKSEYLGGSKTFLKISEVLQTSESSSDNPLGTMAGQGLGALKQRRIFYRCPEHGIIIGLMSIRPKTVYTQGIERAWLKRNRFDYFTREFAHIGAQEILQQELYATADNKEAVFGYSLVGNYQEYRFMNSRVSGNFRTDLNFWNLARSFDSAPALTASFCKMNPRKDIFAVTDETLPAFLVLLENQILAYRPIPKRAKNILK